MLFFKKMSEDEGRRALDSLERAQKLLDERFEKKQIDFNAYQKQCEEFGKRRDKIRRELGDKIFDEITLNRNI